MSKTCVVILNYNNSTDTIKCINMLRSSNLAQKIVVVDNASTEADCAKLTAAISNIGIICLATNIGYSCGNNVGMQWALANTDCKYIFLLNNDAYVEPDCVEQLEAYLDRHADVAVCAPRIMFAHDPATIWYGGGEINWVKGGGVSWNIYKKFDANITPCPVTFISGCAMMLRRDLLLKIGGFDPRFFMYCEDIEFCARIIQSGYKMMYLPSAVVLHRCHGSLRGDNLDYYLDYETSSKNPYLVFTVTHIVCNSLLLFSTHPRGKEKFLGGCYLLGRWIRNCVNFVLAGRFDGVGAIIKGIRLFREKKHLQFGNELTQNTMPIKKIIKL